MGTPWARRCPDLHDPSSKNGKRRKGQTNDSHPPGLHSAPPPPDLARTVTSLAVEVDAKVTAIPVDIDVSCSSQRRRCRDQILVSWPSRQRHLAAELARRKYINSTMLSCVLTCREPQLFLAGVCVCVGVCGCSRLPLSGLWVSVLVISTPAHVIRSWITSPTTRAVESSPASNISLRII